MGTRWREGVFLGHSRSANVYVVGTPEGIKTGRSLQRRPANERWDPDALAAITETPWSDRARPQRTVTFDLAQDQGSDVQTAPAAAIRGMRLNQSDFDRHGYTDGCQQCDHMREHGQARRGTTHAQACRTRMVEAIRQDAAGRRRVEEYEERLDRSVAEAIARAHPRRRSPSPGTVARRRRHDPPDVVGPPIGVAPARPTSDPATSVGAAPPGGATARAVMHQPPVPSRATTNPDLSRTCNSSRRRCTTPRISKILTCC